MFVDVMPEFMDGAAVIYLVQNSKVKRSIPSPVVDWFSWTECICLSFL